MALEQNLLRLLQMIPWSYFLVTTISLVSLKSKKPFSSPDNPMESNIGEFFPSAPFNARGKIFARTRYRGRGRQNHRMSAIALMHLEIKGQAGLQLEIVEREFLDHRDTDFQ
jgi:hypothetical protein